MRRAFVAGFLCLSLSGGCRPLDYLQEPPRSTPAHPAFSEQRLLEHLRYLGMRQEADTTADLRVSYAASRMREFGLQPGLAGSWLVEYSDIRSVGVSPDTDMLSRGMPDSTAVDQASPETARVRTRSHAFGYVAGQDPALSDELVLVCARSREASETAALLVLAEEYAGFATFGSVPGRSILFAAFSEDGPSDWLRHPLWPLRRTRSVICLGTKVDAWIDSGDVPVHFIEPPAAEPGDPAVSAAFHLVRAAHALLLREASSELPPNPSELRIPETPSHR